MSTLIGTQGEERRDFTKAEQKELRQRSLRLLGSLLAPLKKRLIVTALVVVISTAMQVIGPAIIAYGIDSGLPALLKGQALPAGRLRGRLPDRRRARRRPDRGVHGADRADQPGDAHRPARARLRADAAAQPRVPRAVHVGPDHLPPDQRPRLDPRAARRRHQRARAERALHAVHGDRPLPARRVERADPVLLVHPARVPDPLVPAAERGDVPRVAGRLREADRVLRGDDDRHPRGAGVPQGAPQRARLRRPDRGLPVDQRPLHPAVRRHGAGADADRQPHRRGRAAVRRVPGHRERAGDRCAAGGRALRAALLRPDGGHRHLLQRVPVGRGRAREDLRRARGEPDGARAGPTPAARDRGHRTGAVRRCALRVPTGPRDPADLRPRRARRADHRARRLHRCGEVDAGEAHRPLLRPLRRAHQPRRRRPAEPDEPGPAPRHRDGDAGGVPVLRAPSRTTSSSAAPGRPGPRSRRPRARSARTTSSARCPTATTPT